MCNLYRMTKGTAEVAALFAVEDAAAGTNFAAELYPGYPGLVVEGGRLRAMNWGLPVVLTGKQGQKLKPKPVTNARDDKLLTPFWRDSFARRRCLIPVTQWAEPQGPAGRMTRSWYSLPGVEVMVVAGLWRPTAEWGDCYAMVMVDSSPAMAEVHDRMPVILAPDSWEQWTSGSIDHALDLCQTWRGPLLADHTGDRWVDGKPIGTQPPLL
ncbi:SOS response-associated peptidase [Novosphingobium ginsenosidimutans]|uniref:Abasic site processing protein n=1 Tax=Novosphingobium ginsenosidimutans TaxID=1176536 RepID=A0A5B8S2H6_9SPHN|nr:SOS response-associated peptidase family protein [Novosphingobium ginsenosidimutans]QEA15055.1 SOS response-associated peptidase [Novosphingobium ginsenosidimutans]